MNNNGDISNIFAVKKDAHELIYDKMKKTESDENFEYDDELGELGVAKLMEMNFFIKLRQKIMKACNYKNKTTLDNLLTNLYNKERGFYESLLGSTERLMYKLRKMCIFLQGDVSQWQCGGDVVDRGIVLYTVLEKQLGDLQSRLLETAERALQIGDTADEKCAELETRLGDCIMNQSRELDSILVAVRKKFDVLIDCMYDAKYDWKKQYSGIMEGDYAFDDIIIRRVGGNDLSTASYINKEIGVDSGKLIGDQCKEIIGTIPGEGCSVGLEFFITRFQSAVQEKLYRKLMDTITKVRYNANDMIEKNISAFYRSQTFLRKVINFAVVRKEQMKGLLEGADNDRLEERYRGIQSNIMNSYKEMYGKLKEVAKGMNDGHACNDVRNMLKNCCEDIMSAFGDDNFRNINNNNDGIYQLGNANERSFFRDIENI